MRYLQEKYVNPLTDFGFKRLFGTEENKMLLIDFLNQLLPEPHQIADLEFANPERLGLREGSRKGIFDLYCKSPSGERFIVELQKTRQKYFKDRSLYYATFPIQEQAKRGYWNFKLKPVYLIGILDFVFEEEEEEEYVQVFQFKNQNCRPLSGSLKFIFVELPKFEKQLSELDSRLDKWLYAFRNLPELEEVPVPYQDKIFSHLFESAALAKLSDQEELAYEDSLKHFRDLKNIVDTSFSDGIEIGKEMGHVEGHAQGLTQGHAAGMLEGQAKTVLSLFKNGFAPSKIAILIDLTEEEVQTILSRSSNKD